MGMLLFFQLWCPRLHRLELEVWHWGEPSTPQRLLSHSPREQTSVSRTRRKAGILRYKMNTQSGITKYLRKFEATRERPDLPIGDTNIQGDRISSQRKTLEYI